MRFARSLEIRRFLAANGWRKAWRQPFAADASSRTYEQIVAEDGAHVLLMDSPERPDGPPVRDGKPYSAIVHLAETVAPFLAIGAALREQGFIAPELHAADLEAGLLLLEQIEGEPFLDEAGRPVEERVAQLEEDLDRLKFRAGW